MSVHTADRPGWPNSVVVRGERPPLAPIRHWQLLSALLTVACCALALTIVSRIGGIHTTRFLDDIGTVVAAGLAAAASFWAALRSTGRIRRAWWFIAAACTAWTAGETMWGVYELVLHHPNPFPTVADGFYLSAVIPVAIGVFLLPGSPSRPIRRYRAIVDGLIIALGLFLVSWVTVLGPAVAGSADSVLSKVLTVTYPVTDVAVFTIAVLVMSWAPRGARLTIGLMGAGLMAIAIGDTGFGYLQNLNIYSTGNPIDIAYPLAYSLIALAALRPALWGRPSDPLAFEGRLSSYRPYPVVLVALALAGYLQATGKLPWMAYPIIGAILAATAARGAMLTADVRAVMTDRQAAMEARHKAEAERMAVLVEDSIGLRRTGVSVRDVARKLSALGLDVTEAKHAAKAGEAAIARRLASELEALDAVDPAAVMALPINLYFLLGITPDASADEIRDGLRAKAKLCHPDLHRGELADFNWDRLAGIVVEAAQLLQDPVTRRIYDAIWLARSRTAGGEPADPERRSDWVTRCLWSMAVLGSKEDQMIKGLAGSCGPGPAAAESVIRDINDGIAEHEHGRHEARMAAEIISETDPVLGRMVLSELARMNTSLSSLVVSIEGAPTPDVALEPGAAWVSALADLRQSRVEHHRFDLSVGKMLVGNWLGR